MAALWWLAGRNLARTIQGGSASEKTKERQRKEFWILLVAMYVLGFGVALYALLRRP